MHARAALLLAAACGCAAAQPHASIELQPQARVASRTVRLGDLAHVRSDSLELVRALVRLEVEAGSQAHEPSFLVREDLAHAVARRLPAKRADLAWSGSEQVAVLRVPPHASGDAIAAAAVDALQELLQAQGASAQVRVRARPREVPTPDAALHLAVRPLDPLHLHRTPVAWVEVWADDLFVRAVPVSLAIVGGFGGNGSIDAGLPRAAAPAPKLAPAVARGERALLRSVFGSVLLESRVDVLQDGRVGDMVRVRQPGGAGMVLARVVGAGRLELAP